MSSQRERQRERERNQRQLTVPSIPVASNGNSSLFGEPIKQKHDDETSKRIKSTLGDFDQVQKFMINDPKPLLGISTREITRIKGSNAKLQQIFSEMKNTLVEPITALDDLFEDTDNGMTIACNGETVPMINNNNNNNNTTIITNNINISNTNTFYANNGNNNSISNTNLNEIQRIIQITERNNHSNYINDRSLNDDVSDDEHCKPSSKRRKTSSKTDAENGNKTNANNTINGNNTTNNGIIKNSSASSDSSGSSSSNSSSSSESSEDDDDEEEEKVSADIKREECPEKDAPKLSSHSQQPEIAEWNLETFMDKKITTTTTTTSTSVTSSSATVKTNCADNVADVIDKVAKGELGEDCDQWSDDSFSRSPKKKRKTSHQQQNETKRKEPSKQESKLDQPCTPLTPQQQQQQPSQPQPSQHKSAKNQQIKSPDIQDHIKPQQNRQNMSELKSLPKLSSSTQMAAKSLIVSIKLMLLKRIPEVYENNCVKNPLSSSCSSSSSNSSSNGDAVNAIVNDDNMIKPIKTKASQNNNKLEKLKSIKQEKVEDVNVNNKMPRDLAKSITKSKISSSKSSSQPPLESRIATSEHISSSDHLLCDQQLPSVPVKLEPHSPQNHLLAVQMTPTQQITPPFNLPPPPTLIAATIGQNLNSAINLRTPPEIAGTSLDKAPDDYLSSAKKLKHAADREQDRTAQACKYLEAVLFFILTGNAMEQRSAQNEVERVCVMYRETLNLLRVCTTKFTKSRSSHQSNVPTTDYKLTTLSFRCQSLLSLKLSRLKSKEIRENNKLIQQQTQELSLNGSSSAAALVSVMQKQLTLLQQYHTSHDTWQQADHLIEKHPSCKAFFDALDNECGALSLNSTFDHLVHYVKTGLQILK